MGHTGYWSQNNIHAHGLLLAPPLCPRTRKTTKVLLLNTKEFSCCCCSGLSLNKCLTSTTYKSFFADSDFSCGFQTKRCEPCSIETGTPQTSTERTFFDLLQSRKAGGAIFLNDTQAQAPFSAMPPSLSVSQWKHHTMFASLHQASIKST